MVVAQVTAVEVRNKRVLPCGKEQLVSNPGPEDEGHHVLTPFLCWLDHICRACLWHRCSVMTPLVLTHVYVSSTRHPNRAPTTSRSLHNLTSCNFSLQPA